MIKEFVITKPINRKILIEEILARLPSAKIQYKADVHDENTGNKRLIIECDSIEDIQSIIDKHSINTKRKENNMSQDIIQQAANTLKSMLSRQESVENSIKNAQAQIQSMQAQTNNIQAQLTKIAQEQTQHTQKLEKLATFMTLIKEAVKKG